MSPPVLRRTATQDSKGAAPAGLRSYPAIPKRNVVLQPSRALAATLHPAQRSPCYVVQDRYS